MKFPQDRKCVLLSVEMGIGSKGLGVYFQSSVR